MKTKTFKAKLLVKLSFILLIAVFVTACSNSGEKNDSKDNHETIKTAKPKIDIHTAALTGNVDVLEQHVMYGTDLNSKDPYANSTPLITASVFGKINAVKFLIDAGADLNALNNDGATALHSAAFFCNTEIVEVLLEAGIDKTVRNKYGQTALESVQIPFNDVKSIYVMFSESMGQMGLVIDLEQIETTRPVVAELLK